MNIALIGMRGAGKSNVARRVGFKTKMPVLSTDVLVNYEAGLTTTDLVAKQGWPAFRELEYEVLRKAVALDGLVLDCGGGILIDLDRAGREQFSERKAELLRTHSTVIWLRGDIPTLAAKVDRKSDPNRPALAGTESTEAMMRRREPFFTDVSDIIIDIDGRTRQSLAEQIISNLRLTPFK